VPTNAQLLNDPCGSNKQEIPMLRKSTLLAVAASALFGLALIAPTAASAHGGGGGGHGGGGMHAGGGHGGGGHGGGLRTGGRGHGGGHVNLRHPGGRNFGHNHYHWRYAHFHRPIWVGSPVVYSTGYSVARPLAAGPCTCLSKEYTQDGAVLFKDNCTNEAAMNPPAPQQTGELEPQK
jgi:hypothetical protein